MKLFLMFDSFHVNQGGDRGAQVGVMGVGEVWQGFKNGVLTWPKPNPV